MQRAAGILIVSPTTGRLLLLRRAPGGTDHGGEWAFPGGGIEEGETAEEAARRELTEETGLIYDGPLIEWTRRQKDNVDFTTFLARSDEFEPTLNAEHDLHRWIERGKALAEPATDVILHPGARIALQRFGMNELGVAKAIRDGELVSPQSFGNMLLIAIRITGTGMSYRSALKEYVWRSPELFTTDEFLERCQGLPAIWEHPGKDSSPGGLNSAEFHRRMVGTAVVPYRRETERGIEVWAIAKIWDAEAAKLLKYFDLSTSPGVVFTPLDGNECVKFEGASLLVEGVPSLLDHIALVPLGVWDKQGPPAGIESVYAEESRLDSALSVLRDSSMKSVLARMS